MVRFVLQYPLNRNFAFPRTWLGCVIDGYGYLWWLKNFQVNGIEYNSYQTSGWGGQEIFVFDGLEMIVVFTGANYVTYHPGDEIVRNYILSSLN